MIFLFFLLDIEIAPDSFKVHTSYQESEKIQINTLQKAFAFAQSAFLSLK